jgi:hypothetical protein
LIGSQKILTAATQRTDFYQNFFATPKIRRRGKNWDRFKKNYTLVIKWLKQILVSVNFFVKK